jgi:cell division septal protein FtsQ
MGRLFRLTAILAILAGLAYGGRAGAGWIAGTSLFRLEKIAVRGLNAVPPEMIADLVAVEPGTNLFRIETGEVENRLAALDRVEEVRVKRALPRTLAVTVVERIPVALAAFPEIHEVDADGWLMETIDGATLPDLPLITGVKKEDFENPDSPKGKSLIRLVSDLSRLERERPWLVDILSDIRVRTDGGLEAHAQQGGVKILLGDRLDPVQLGILHTMLRDLDRIGSEAAAIDLRYRKQGILRRS